MRSGNSSFPGFRAINRELLIRYAMTLLPLFLIAVGLSMDAFAVAISCGLAARPLRFIYAFRVAFFFGVFQALMPVLGWGAGVGLRAIIDAFDHWIAFVLLVVVGCKMIYGAFRGKKTDEPCRAVSLGGLLVLAVATSIDALAVGMSFAFLNEAILAPALIIGAVTFAISLGGVWLGSRFGHIFENKLEIAGGLILIAIAFKILLSHLLA